MLVRKLVWISLLESILDWRVSPNVVDGHYVDAIPELVENIIRNGATFVDIIHTNGAFEPVKDCNNQIESCTDVAAYIIRLHLYGGTEDFDNWTFYF